MYHILCPTFRTLNENYSHIYHNICLDFSVDLSPLKENCAIILPAMTGPNGVPGPAVQQLVGEEPISGAEPVRP